MKNLIKGIALLFILSAIPAYSAEISGAGIGQSTQGHGNRGGGTPGQAATVTVGTTTTLSPGANATVTNSGSTSAAVLNFGIPAGATGATGPQGPQGVAGPTGATGPQGAAGNGSGNLVSNSISGDFTFNGQVGIISAGAITLAKMANETAYTMLGNNTSSAATPIALTSAQIKAFLNYYTSGDNPTFGTITGGNLTTANVASGNALRMSAIEFPIGGPGATITTGTQGYVEMPFAGTIQRATLVCTASGSISVDIKKSTYANFPTTASITASAPLVLSSAQKTQNTSLTGWTTALNAGDILEFYVNSVSGESNCTASLVLQK